MATVLHDCVFKYIVIGDVAVGKSCFLFQFTDNSFMEESAQTICVEFTSKIVQVTDKRCKLQIWDTSGQDRFREIAKTYYRGSACIFLMYDVTRRSTFEHIKGWLNDAKASAVPSTMFVLIGNKSEPGTVAEVTTEEGKALAQQAGMLFFEVSAKTGHNVQNSVIEATHKVLANAIAEGVDLTAQGQKMPDSLTSSDSLLDNPDHRLGGLPKMRSIEWAYSLLASYSMMCVATHHQPRMAVRLCVLPWQVLGRLLVFSFYLFVELAFILPCMFLMLVQRPKQIPLKSPSINDSVEISQDEDKEPISFPLFIVKSLISHIFIFFYPLLSIYYLIPIYPSLLHHSNYVIKSLLMINNYIIKMFQKELVAAILGLQMVVLVILSLFGIIRRLQKRSNPLIISRSEEMKMDKYLHKFRWSVVGNYIVIFLLILEWMQVVGYSIRIVGGEKFFNFFYLYFPNHSSTMTLFWVCILLIVVLLVVVNLHIMADLRHYLLLRSQGKLEEAFSSFYFSLVGSVVFGHGKPDNVSNFTRYTVMIITDGLFFLILFQLYSIFPCTYGSISSEVVAHLIQNPELICWDHDHYLAAFFAMFFIGYYTLFSNLVSPIIVESRGVSEFHGMYTSSVNLVKLFVLYHTILLLSAVFPSEVPSFLFSTTPTLSLCIAGLVLFGAILAWTLISSTKMRQPSQSAGANVTRAFTYACSAVVGLIGYASMNHSKGAGAGAVSACIIVLFVAGVAWYVLYRRRSTNYGEFTKMATSTILIEEGSEMGDL